MMVSEIVPVSKFGKDHASLLLYIETRVVDYGGRIDFRHLRTHDGKAQHEHHTFLRGGEQHPDPEHDDWACLNDLIAAGYCVVRGNEEELSGQTTRRDTERPLELTDKGWVAAWTLRQRKAQKQLVSTWDWVEIPALESIWEVWSDRQDNQRQA
jgi:hypothetical protein